MKLVRFGERNQEKPGLLDAQGRRRDCSAHVADWDRAAFSAGALDVAAALDVEALPLAPEGARWGACVARPGKIMAIGLNYEAHIAESDWHKPEEPLLFMKAPNSACGPHDDLLLPRGSEHTDWEVELGVVIGREARYLDSPGDSEAHIAGYCVGHDVSERHFQKQRSGQWCKGKSADTFCPMGPMLVTPDEAGDVGNLRLTTDISGVRKQDGNTGDLLFDPFVLVHYLSQFMTLEPGDLIMTGTPPGVGMGRDPQEFLKEGDTVEMTVEGLGTIKQRVRRA